jgi:hypothetical protein
VNPQQWVFNWLLDELDASMGYAASVARQWEQAAEVAATAITGNVTPVVQLGDPLVSNVGEAVTLRASADDSDGRIARTFWNLGDGTYAEGESVEHTYSEPGTYSVLFSATDDQGATTTEETTVSVETPGSLSLIRPADGAATRGPVLAWKPTARAREYKVTVVTYGTQAVYHEVMLQATACGVAACRHRLPGVTPPGTYQWTVSAVNEFGSGPNAAPRTFTVPARSGSLVTLP